MLHTLAKNPLGVQRAEEVDPGVGHQKNPDVLEATKETARHANSKSECKSHLVQPESPFEVKEGDVQPESPHAKVKQGDVQPKSPPLEVKVDDVQPECPPAGVRESDVQGVKIIDSSYDAAVEMRVSAKNDVQRSSLPLHMEEQAYHDPTSTHDVQQESHAGKILTSPSVAISADNGQPVRVSDVPYAVDVEIRGSTRNHVHSGSLLGWEEQASGLDETSTCNVQQSHDDKEKVSPVPPAADVHGSIGQHPDLQDDFRDEAIRWKDVQMPLPLQVRQGQCPQPRPSVLSPKVLVLDMNGVLLRQYPYGEIPVLKSDFPWRKVYKGRGNFGTLCIIRPDAYDFVSECGNMFYLCLWSSCSLTNINVVMKDCFRGLHPKIWKMLLSQK